MPSAASEDEPDASNPSGQQASPLIRQQLASELREMTRRCERGDAKECRRIAVIYMQGEGVPKDEKLSVEFLRKGCDGGYALACEDLGAAHGLGLGVEADPQRMVELLDRSCGNGSVDACLSLGNLYRSGQHGVAANRDKAIESWRRGCDGPTKPEGPPRTFCCALAEQLCKEADSAACPK